MGILPRCQPRVREFAQPLIEGMVAHLPEIDERIRRYCENYEFRRISAVDRNVLRLAIYEMLYRDDIPPVVSINEAIELAKTIRWRRFRPICERNSRSNPKRFGQARARGGQTRIVIR